MSTEDIDDIQHPEVKDRLLRSVNVDAWREMKALAALRGITLGQAINEAMVEYLEKGKGGPA